MPFRWPGRQHDGNRIDTIWALQGVSFEVHQGEVLGVIGRNGAGKSTLLKILSRITEPTTGSVEIYGRVGSLLEVGTGFHPELTGRDNIYLNGAVLGMRRAEIDVKFDEIVAFSEVEKFIDTPVKHYSSGMYLRLAFAVAAHLEPEILLVDEVLAVGDIEFQKKCLGRMDAVSRAGRTVLFVSHNLSSIAQLCQRGLLLDQGKVVHMGDIRSVIETYVNFGQYQQAEAIFPEDASKPVQVQRLQILNDGGQLSSELDRTRPFQMAIEVYPHQTVRGTVNVALNTNDGVRVCHSVCADSIRRYTEFRRQMPVRFMVSFPGGLLNEGHYTFTVWVVPGNVGIYDVASSPMFHLRALNGTDSFIGERKKHRSILCVPLKWEVVEN